jgi:hypothetical protein
VTGVPGVVKKSVSPEVRAHILTASQHYVENTRRMRDAISTPLA